MRNRRKTMAGVALGILLGLCFGPVNAAEPENLAGTGTAEEVAIDERNFPDEVFRRYVSENCDTDGNGSLSESEISGCTEIDVGLMRIESLEGIRYFTSLTYLACYNNNLSSLDVSKNTSLTYSSA